MLPGCAALRRPALPRRSASGEAGVRGRGNRALAGRFLACSLAALAASGFASPPAREAAPPLAAAPASRPLDARGWIARIQSAASIGNYQGTMVFSKPGMLSSTRVAHYAVGDQVYEQLEALDGRMQRIVRHNDLVHTLWPQQRVAVVERRETMGRWSTTPQEVEPLALEHYELRRQGNGRVAGREALIFTMEPRDGLRYAQRLWVDAASGLMLRADVMGATRAEGRPVLESTAFSEVAIGVRPQPDVVLQELRNPRRFDGYRVERPQQQRTTLEAEGWALARPVPGFLLSTCMRRGMETAGDGEPVLQAVFFDGITHVSLFIELYRVQRHRSEQEGQQGATSALMTRRGDHWLTVVGDVPPATLRLFADALDRVRR